jgi:hypothetical protein
MAYFVYAYFDGRFPCVLLHHQGRLWKMWRGLRLPVQHSVHWAHAVAGPHVREFSEDEDLVSESE